MTKHYNFKRIPHFRNHVGNTGTIRPATFFRNLQIGIVSFGDSKKITKKLNRVAFRDRLRPRVVFRDRLKFRIAIGDRFRSRVAFKDRLKPRVAFKDRLRPGVALRDSMRPRVAFRDRLRPRRKSTTGADTKNFT